MTRHCLFPFVLVLAFIPACPGQQPPPQQQAPIVPPIDIYFSPKGGCTEAVVKELGKAEKTILVQAYSFTSAPIAKALVEARRRGVDVRVILDKSQRTEKYSEADFLVNVGIPVRIDAQHAIAHNKIMILDGRAVITGSFNFTKSAEENNAENLLVIRDWDIAKKYTSNWDKHIEHSQVYEKREKGYSETHETGSAAPAISTGFVASKNSQVFHRPECESAAKISEKNLMHYATRAEAIQAGRKPCHECNP
jgi:phosphatidylserine/phosphatidylglycerophosphate/cardiolipin synthase-like enzyme